MPIRRILLTFVVLLLLGAPAAAVAQSIHSEYDGAAATGLALRRLGTTARVLHIAAHPDDENTALFAPLALGRGVDAAYLSLTRGEGGQNGIGPELGVALGVIRSEELLAARRLDGGVQFFSRAIDYGYSKDAEEAFRHWPKDTLLADVVEVIRRYRPDVVVSVWSGTDRDGHGQHEAAGIIAREAVLAAGDPDRFPEQIADGLRPHTPALYYRSAWFSDSPPDVELNTGELDPVLGASYHQIAMASRSLHRSQDQGRRLSPGPRNTAFDRVDPAAPVEVSPTRGFGRYGDGAARSTASLFEGVDTLLSQRAAAAARTTADADGPAMARTVEALKEYERLVAEARSELRTIEPWTVLPTLLEAQKQLETAFLAYFTPYLHEKVPDDGSRPDGTTGALKALEDLTFYFMAEVEDLRTAIHRAANIELDVVADHARVIPGQTFDMEVSLWNGGVQPVEARIKPLLPEGWTAEWKSGDRTPTVPAGERAAVTYAVTVPPDARPTMPYYLDPREPEPEDLYRWPDDPAVRGLPFAPAPAGVRYTLDFDYPGPVVPVDRDAYWIGVDRRAGEYREPLRVVPAVSVSLDPGLAVIPLGAPDQPLAFTVRLRSQAPDGIGGELRPVVPEGWTVTPEAVPVAFDGGAAERTIGFRVRAPADVEAGEYEVRAQLVTERGTFDLGYTEVDYPHIAPHNLYQPARARVRALDVQVADVTVGYVAGAGDGVPEALDQLGVDWAPLDADALADGDLDRFDVIITGTRAYEVNDDLVAHNQRLLDWARRGGTLVVQYNKYPALDRDYTPWPVTIARPHGRVTDETAPVRILAPDHPTFTTPNAIGPADWEGWVQERGLYFWDSWPESLTPLLAMADPGEAPLEGSLLVGPLGQGTYVYTALAFFRQLPEGVPGAYRLLANLISMGASP